jgi:hypothetical protein
MVQGYLAANLLTLGSGGGISRGWSTAGDSAIEHSEWISRLGTIGKSVSGSAIKLGKTSKGRRCRAEGLPAS